MRFKSFAAIAAVSGAMMSTNVAGAAVVASWEPPPTGGNAYSNLASSNNFLVSFTLTQDTQIDGFALWTDRSFGALGNSVTVKIRNDVGSDTPAPGNLFTIAGTITSSTAPSTANTARRVESDFAPVTLKAGTYWMGMSGGVIGSPDAPKELGWDAYGCCQFPGQYYLTQDTLFFRPNLGHLAFEVLGTAVTSGAAPEPASWALMMVGVGGLGAALRVRRRRAAA